MTIKEHAIRTLREKSPDLLSELEATFQREYASTEPFLRGEIEIRQRYDQKTNEPIYGLAGDKKIIRRSTPLSEQQWQTIRTAPLESIIRADMNAIVEFLGRDAWQRVRTPLEYGRIPILTRVPIIYVIAQEGIRYSPEARNAHRRLEKRLERAVQTSITSLRDLKTRCKNYARILPFQGDAKEVRKSLRGIDSEDKECILWRLYTSKIAEALPDSKYCIEERHGSRRLMRYVSGIEPNEEELRRALSELFKGKHIQNREINRVDGHYRIPASNKAFSEEITQIQTRATKLAIMNAIMQNIRESAGFDETIEKMDEGADRYRIKLAELHGIDSRSEGAKWPNLTQTIAEERTKLFTIITRTRI